MKVAVDVKGTLEGPKREQILRLMMFFQDQGYEVVVWSNFYSFADDAVKDLAETSLKDIIAECKKAKWETEEQYDIAIEDDRSQTWLAVKNFIWVDEIPLDTPIAFVKERLASLLTD